MEKKKGIAYLSILLAGCLWGSMGLFVHTYHDRGLQSMDIVAIRGTATAILLFFFLLIVKRELLRIRKKDIWCFLGTGIGSIVFFNYCYFKTITLTSMSVAAVLLYTAPAIVMILSRILFRERLTKRKLIALGVTFAGCVLVTGVLGSTQALNAKGIIIGLGSGLGYALYSIFSRYALERGYHTFTISFYTFLIVAITTLPFVDQGSVGAAVTESVPMFFFFLVFGLASTVLPYILYTYGLKQVENGTASVIASVEPLVATLLGMLCYGERMTGQQAVGMVLILGAIVLCNTAEKA